MFQEFRNVICWKLHIIEWMNFKRSSKDGTAEFGNDGSIHLDALLHNNSQRSFTTHLYNTSPQNFCTKLHCNSPPPCTHWSIVPGQLDPSLQRLILHWHHHTHYHIEVNNTWRSIPVNRGVRQGCSIAPFLWSVIMALLLDDLQACIPRTWLLEHITILRMTYMCTVRFVIFQNSHKLWPTLNRSLLP